MDREACQEELLLDGRENEKGSSQHDVDGPSVVRRYRSLWKIWIIITLLAVLNCFLSVAYIHKKPSDRQCNDQLSLWCKLGVRSR